MSKIIQAFEKEVNQTEKDISALRERKKGLVIDVSTDSGFTEARKERTEMNKSLKEIDTVAIKGKRDIDDKREVFKDVVRGIYKPIVSLFETEDLRRKEVKKQDEIKEAARVKDIRDQINGIRQFSLNLQGKTSLEISEIIEAVTLIDISENFAECTQEVIQVKNEVLGELNVFLSSAIQNEQLEKDRLLLAKEKEETDEKNRLIELKQKAQERLNNLMMTPVSYMGKSSAEIIKKIHSLKTYEIPKEQFGELFESAKSSVVTVIEQLGKMYTQQLLVEANEDKDAESINKDDYTLIDDQPEIKHVQEEVDEVEIVKNTTGYRSSYIGKSHSLKESFIDTKQKEYIGKYFIVSNSIKVGNSGFDCSISIKYIGGPRGEDECIETVAMCKHGFAEVIVNAMNDNLIK